MTPGRAVCLAAPACIGTATAAAAHGSLAGGGGFYAGAAHPFLAFEHLMVLAALGLLLGRRGRAGGRPVLLALAAGLGCGLAAGAGFIRLPEAVPALVTDSVLGLALTLGAVLALALTFDDRVGVPLAAGIGVVLGLDTGVPPGVLPGAVETAAPYAGVFVGVFLIVLDAMALGSAARRPMFRLAPRIAGSWITAIAVMVLALHLRMTGAAG